MFFIIIIKSINCIYSYKGNALDGDYLLFDNKGTNTLKKFIVYENEIARKKNNII